MNEQIQLFDAPPAVVEVDGRGLTIQQRFELFREANPWVEEALSRLALDLHARGRGRIGMKMLVEVVRWDYTRTTSDPTSSFRINNDFTSRYARILIERHPELGEAFETRELRAA